MVDDKMLTKRIETAIHIEESLAYLIGMATPTKEKVYRIYRQFREWGYHYTLEEIEKKCKEFYRRKNHFNQARMIKDLFRINPTSEVSNLLGINFRSAKLELSELNEVSSHLFSLLKRVIKPEDFGIDPFLTQIAVKQLTSPNWNNGEIFFSFEDFYSALEWASFRRFGSKYHDCLKLLFYSMDPAINTDRLKQDLIVSAESQKKSSQPGVEVEKGGTAGEFLNIGEIDRLNNQDAFNDNFSALTQVMLQAEYLWIRDLEMHFEEKLKSRLPEYPLKKESDSKDLRELEAQVRLFNSILLLEAKTRESLTKYVEIEGILKNTILTKINSILDLYTVTDIEPLKIKGPGSDSAIRKKQYVLPQDLAPSDVDCLVSPTWTGLISRSGPPDVEGLFVLLFGVNFG